MHWSCIDSTSCIRSNIYRSIANVQQSEKNNHQKRKLIEITNKIILHCTPGPGGGGGGGGGGLAVVSCVRMHEQKKKR